MIIWLSEHATIPLVDTSKVFTEINPSIREVTFAFPERTDGDSHAFSRDWPFKSEMGLQNFYTEQVK